MEELSRNGRESEKKQRSRFMGKLFKEHKKPTSEVEVQDFLHGTTDKFLMLKNSSNLPPEARINNSQLQERPTLEITSSSPVKKTPLTPKRRRKGLIVHFDDSKAELIGEGGELSEDPPINVSLQKMARLHPFSTQLKENCSLDNHESYDSGRGVSPKLDHTEDNSRISLQEINQQIETNKERINIRESNGNISNPDIEQLPRGSRDIHEDSKTQSFSQRVKNEMRFGEGRTLVASRNSIALEDLSQTLPIEGTLPQAEPSPPRTTSNLVKSDSTRLISALEPSTNEELIESSGSMTTSKELPLSLQISQNKIDSKTPNIPDSTASKEHPLSLQIWQNRIDTKTPNFLETTFSKNSPCDFPETAISLDKEALTEFAKRTVHMTTLFRLSTEATKPVETCPPELLLRAGIWWFLKGRMDLEASVRERAATFQAQTTDPLNLSQTYMDIAKAFWILDILASRSIGAELELADKNIYSDSMETQKLLICSMRKLVMSMRRNRFFPPSTNNSIINQKLDPTFWSPVEGDKSMIVGQRLLSIPSLSESLPLGDTTHLFHYGRFFAEAVLTENGTSQRYQCQVLLSIIRHQKEKLIQAIIANQCGSLNFAIQSDKTKGPTWESLEWHAKGAIIEVRLPRGFLLSLHCSELDFGKIWRLYDHQKKVYDFMSQRPDEEFAYETILKNFHYINETPNPNFTKEPQPCCHIRLYEKSLIPKAAASLLKTHQGFRIAIVTSPSTKKLGGIEFDLPSKFPIEFSFLRGDGESPALLLKIGSGISKCILIATFKEITERNLFHALLSGRALGPDEAVIAKGNVKAFTLSTVDQKFISLPQTLEWQGFVFINQQHGDLQSCKTILSEKLRMIIEFKYGTMTDRINVGPGELKLRLDPRNSCVIQVLRQPQTDWTTLIESQAPKGSPQELEGMLNTIKEYDSVRVYTFPSMAELHLFQLALTGFEVLFDDVVTTFNISRRRMVVPIYKKWDASIPRIQVLKKEKIIQLIVFFENFSHGECMSFALRSTDVFEGSSRGGRYFLRIVDAKFALPKIKEDGNGFDHEFLSLDMPDYPGEHDDISIYFENENSHEKFMKLLPAPVKQISRMGSVMR